MSIYPLASLLLTPIFKQGITMNLQISDDLLLAPSFFICVTKEHLQQGHHISVRGKESGIKLSRQSFFVRRRTVVRRFQPPHNFVGSSRCVEGN